MLHAKQMGAAAPVKLKKGFNIHLLVFLLTVPALWLVWSLTNQTYLWPLWQTGAWVIGIVFHYMGVFVFKKAKRY
ncbi:MAG: 2TM domain-containing protein [Dyadobacter sp.]|uniref:2TM domain-containing protein n=1 Tax=Dyadobacter sp. TaxID=1914288 RepID=UPI001B011F9B|nr:2TM domain-containing protein [Dyadobacter sp.]MBO9611446.1 2TM domain-containing protein [Dyadobacter sp.]